MYRSAAALQSQVCKSESESNAMDLGLTSTESKDNRSSNSDPSNSDNGLLCVICNDKASGKHYGVISCEGCKGFFKRTVRKQLNYVCRESGQCPVDRRKRTRCQHCRFEQCLSKGMRREGNYFVHYVYIFEFFINCAN